jgi:hypothetical protein
LNRDLILFGIVALVVGLGTGYLIFAHPEGLNREWPIWMASLAPASFTLAGLHMVAGGLGYPRFSVAMLQLIAVCLWVIVNWAAFLTTSIHCLETVSFLGIAIFNRCPTEIECRDSLRMIIVCIDAMIALPFVVFARRKTLKLQKK